MHSVDEGASEEGSRGSDDGRGKDLTKLADLADMTSANVPGDICEEAQPLKALFYRSLGRVDFSMARFVVACAKYLYTIREKYYTLVCTLGILAPAAIAIEKEVGYERMNA